jgi:hypothetical protein
LWFKVLVALYIKIIGFWEVMPCSFIDGCHASNKHTAFTFRGRRILYPEYEDSIFL